MSGQVWNVLDLHRRTFADCLEPFPALQATTARLHGVSVLLPQEFFKTFAAKKRINKYLRSAHHRAICAPP